MITAIDTNILHDVLACDPVYGEASKSLVWQHIPLGPLVVCEVVWAEVASFFESQTELHQAFSALGVELDSSSPETLWRASEIRRDYIRRGGKRGRIIPDFMIGAHAHTQCDALLTRDVGFYRDYFSGLNVITP